ncbi:hypothetical protein [Nocardioides speluncae]|uniref:hypothetical protein n=1 Tax=Nocardioides speluncae TaxID=2670337 RepID=UPI000D68CE02|nr:hypothetical protein [Nocardioides speluncae]
MIPDLEDRLTAALAARADLIQPDDLRPLAPPRRQPRRSVALLAAASVVIAGTIAAVWLTSGDDRPEPAKPLPDGYVEIDRLSGDVDGDGRDDLVRLARPTDQSQIPSSPLLVADLATAGREVAKLDAGPTSRQIGLTGIGLPGEAVVVRRPEAGADALRLEIYAIDGDAGLRRIPERKQNRSSLTVRADRAAFATTPELTTWSSLGRNPDRLQVQNVYRWAYRDGEVVPESTGIYCWRAGEPVPTMCPAVLTVPSGVSATDSVSADLDGDGFVDPIAVYPAYGAVSMSLIFAQTYEDGKAGAYLPTSISGRIDRVRLRTDGSTVEAVIVEDALASTLFHVFGWADGQLRELRVSKDTPLRPETAPGLTTAPAPNRELLTWEFTEDSPSGVRTVQVYRWDLRDRVLVPVDLGERCLDPGRGKLPRAC